MEQVNKTKKIASSNPIVNYFVPFGLKQVCDILMIAGAILLIVGLSISKANLSASIVVLGVGLGIYIAASALAIVRCTLVLCSGINHRSPEYKRATVNVSIMAVICALAIFGLVWLLVA